MNTVSQNRGLFLTVRTGWDLGSGFYTDPKFAGDGADYNKAFIQDLAFKYPNCLPVDIKIRN